MWRSRVQWPLVFQICLSNSNLIRSRIFVLFLVLFSFSRYVYWHSFVISRTPISVKVDTNDVRGSSSILRTRTAWLLVLCPHWACIHALCNVEPHFLLYVFSYFFFVLFHGPNSSKDVKPFGISWRKNYAEEPTNIPGICFWYVQNLSLAYLWIKQAFLQPKKQNC